MGLNASVYLDDAEAEGFTSVRLGNLSTVDYLARVIGSQVPTASVLLEKVLYSGSHSGDSLSIKDVKQVKIELAEVKHKLAHDVTVQAFTATFGPIIEAAIIHSRPVTF